MQMAIAAESRYPNIDEIIRLKQEAADLGVAVMFKIYPAFLLLYFLLRRRFGVIAGAAFSSLVCGRGIEVSVFVACT